MNSNQKGIAAVVVLVVLVFLVIAASAASYYILKNNTPVYTYTATVSPAPNTAVSSTSADKTTDIEADLNKIQIDSPDADLKDLDSSASSL